MPHKFKSPTTFTARIAAEKLRLEAEAAEAEPGAARSAVLKKLRQLDVAAHLNDWLSSPRTAIAKWPMYQRQECIDGKMSALRKSDKSGPV